LSDAGHPHIAVSTRQVPAFSAEIVAVPAHLDYVVVTVADNGCGMDEPTLGRVGEPFFTTKAPGAGTGLGLSSAFGILKEHGGNLECESMLGHGTTFSVWLPLAAGVPDSTRVANDTTLPRARASRDTVLLIDDEPTVRRAYSRLLERAGFCVVGAADGERGLELFRETPEKYAVVLLDLSMPRLSGAEVLQRILETAPDARVIILTGHAAPSQNLEGARAVLKKPVTRARLLEELESVRA
jgi:CheY-like chemotaxis protein